MEGYRNFNILDIILRYREHTASHGNSLGAATEIGNLENLINHSSRICCNGTRTGNESIRIQVTINGNIAVSLHANKTLRARGRAAIRIGFCVFVFARDAHSTIDDQLCTICHRQSPIGSRGNIAGALRLSGIHRMSIIEGNQQGYTAINGICTRRKNTIVIKNNDLAG